MNEKTRSILELIKERRGEVLRRYMRAVESHQGRKASIATWDAENRDYLGPPFGRPNIAGFAEAEAAAKADLEYIDGVYDYAVETFIGD